MDYKWDFRFIIHFLPALGHGLLVTIYVSLVAILFGTVVGVSLAVMKRSQNRFVSSLSELYIKLFLAFPVLVLIIWLYYCLPVLLKVHLSSTWTAIIALTLSLGGFIGDIVRAGIDAVPKGQIECAYSLGLSYNRTMYRIVLPQAIKMMIPPILGQYITCIKLSSLASIIAVYELLHTANNIISTTYKPLEMYTITAALYIIIILPMVYVMRYFEMRTLGFQERSKNFTVTKLFFLKWFRNA